MKRKIFLSLLLLFLFAAAGAVITTVSLKNTISSLNRLVSLHEIKDLRQDLVISIQDVQSGLYTLSTKRDRDLATISNNLSRVEQSARACMSCHHAAPVVKQLQSMQTQISGYRIVLDRYVEAVVRSRDTNKLKLDTVTVGNHLLHAAEGMSLQASKRFGAATNETMKKIETVWMVFAAVAFVTFFLCAVVAWSLIRSVTRPIELLVDATRSIAAGNIGSTISYEDKTEFGELAKNFNDMSLSLKKSYAKLEDEINERKWTDSELKKSEAFLATIFSSIRDPFCIIDDSYRIVRANQAYADMKHIALENLIGKICYETLYGRAGICDECSVQKSFRTKTACARRKMELPPHGAKIWREIYTYPIEDGDGKVTHVIEYSRDITERKNAEERLRESEERYALAASGANDGLWDWDLRRKKMYFSDRWKSMLGYVEKEIGEDPEEWFSRVHDDDRQELRSKINAHLNGRNPHFEAEFRMKHKDGSPRWFISRGIAVREADGKAYRMAGSQTETTLRKKAEERLLHDAFHDHLTGLPNRALFMDRLQQVITTSRRRTSDLYAVLFMDMDRFKIINDTLGHAVGDALLAAVGKELLQCLRPGDTVARIGGDEFAILLKNIKSLEDVLDVTKRVQKQLSNAESIKQLEISCSVSIGIALGSDRYDRPEQILRDADIAMYQAKTYGNGRYELFDIAMHATILERQQLEADLRCAVEKKQLILHYQPILDLKTRRLTGFEVLVRWVHPRRGVLYPREFIPLAEEKGLIEMIGDWVLRESCKQMRVLQGRYPMEPPLKMSVNISGKQFITHDFSRKVQSVLRETGLDPHTLVLEITESMIMENIDVALNTMRRLREMGVQIHIDDFGTGYSSLSYLQYFPVDALKIDKTFVEKLSTDGQNREIILSILSLAKSLKLDVIAEGLELSHQLSTITDMKCEYGQGFLFAQPMDLNDIHTWMQKEPQIQ